MFNLKSRKPTVPALRVPILGMTCDRCARQVESALRSVPGVKGVKVDPMLGLADISGTFDPRAVALAVAATGYQAIIE